MLRENGKRIWEKKHSLLHWQSFFFSFFWIGNVKHTGAYFKKHINGLYLGETEGLKSIIKS